MKIRTQLFIGLAIFAVLLLLVSALVITTNQDVEQLNREDAVAQDIVLKVGELSYLSNDYILYREQQQADRWESKYASISDDVASLSENTPEQLSLVSSLRANLRNLRSVFDDLVSAPVRPAQAGGEPDPAFIQLSWSRLAVQTQGMVFDASQLSNLLRDESNRKKMENNLLTLSLMGLFSAFLFTSYFLFFRRTLRSITDLQEGARVIGSGNLDHAISEKSDDEIGELARAFNRMTTSLKAVTASKADLEREIAERRQAEGALKETVGHLRILYESMTEGLANYEVVYEEGKAVDYIITDVNPAFGTITGLARADSVGRRASELYSTGSPPYLDVYARVAAGGAPETFETYFPPTKQHFSVSAFSPGKGKFATVFTDITERKQAEEDLRQLAQFPGQNPNPVMRITFDGAILYANSPARTWLGELDWVQGEPLPAALRAIADSSRSDEHEHQSEITARHGRVYRLFAVRPPGEVYVNIYARDITEQKRAEEVVREAEVRYRTIADNTYDWEFWLDPAGRFKYCSPSCERVTGYRPEEFHADPGLRGRSIHPDDRAEFEKHVQEIERGQVIGRGEWRYVRPDGSMRWIEHICQPVYGDNGEFLGTRASNRDITDRKMGEEALRETSQYLENLITYANAPIIVWDPKFRITRFNHAFESLTGMAAEDVVGKGLQILFPAETAADSMDHIRRVMAGERWEAVEIPILNQDGEIRTVLWNSATLYEADGRTVSSAIAQGQDITERKQAEERIAHLASFPELNPNPILELAQSGEVIYTNPAVVKTLANLGLGENASAFVPEDIQYMLPRLPEGDVLSEIQVGERVFIETITLNPQTRTTRIYARDITDRKQAEEALRNTSQYLENLLNYANAPIIVWDPQFRITRFNHAFERLTGLAADEVVGKSLEILFPKETIAESMDHIRRVMAGERWEAVEIPILNKDRGIRTILWNSATLYEADGKTVISAIAQGQDITDRKQAEEALRDTSQYLENLINYANAPIIVWDPDFRITRFNQAFERLTGRAAGEVLGKGLEILFPRETAADSMDHIRRVMAGERWEVVEIPILNKDGGIRTVLWNSATLYEADGRTVSSAIAQGHDITERKTMEEEIAEKVAELGQINAELHEEVSQKKKAEQAVRSTLSQLHAALESTADAMLVADKQGRITSYNRNFTSMWNMPDSVLSTLDNRAALEFVSLQVKDPDGFIARMQEISDHPQREAFDTLELLDGRIIERYSKPQKIGNSIVGRVFSFRDVTERKHSEERLIASLEEKEVLLREIHHRVKNNLQLTSSLLDMTRMRTRDKGTSSILTDIMMKIQTMAQIHTRLYESKVFDRIDMEAQVREQLASVSTIYSSGKTEITTTIDFPRIYMPIDQAIPCALVINEILSNAYKHAFRGRETGTVEIAGVVEGDRIRITVRDDGVGMPEGFDISRASSLGLKLVRNLVQQQLKGTLGIKRDHGTEVIVELPISTPEREDVKDTGS